MGKRYSLADPLTISPDAAVERLDRIGECVKEDVLIALSAKASLEAANAVAPADPNIKPPAPEIYKATSQGLMVDLALTMARLFERGLSFGHPDTSDVASIPLMIRLLRHPACADLLANRAVAKHKDKDRVIELSELYTRDYRDAIARAIRLFDKMMANEADQAALARVKEFRDRRLAHHLTRKPKQSEPIYSDIFLLFDRARDIVDRACISINGLHLDLARREGIANRRATTFWTLALSMGKSTTA